MNYTLQYYPEGVPKHLEIFEKYIDRIIYLSQKHIDKGEKFNCKKCPVALALIDVLGRDYDFIDAFAYNVKIGLDEHLNYCIFKYSNDLVNWIENYDLNRLYDKVEPVKLKFVRLDDDYPHPTLVINDA